MPAIAVWPGCAADPDGEPARAFLSIAERLWRDEMSVAARVAKTPHIVVS